LIIFHTAVDQQLSTKPRAFNINPTMSHSMHATRTKSRAHDNDNEPPIAYQVDYVAVNCGKIVRASKKKIRFKFGYSDKEALAAGKTGQACRASEHEVIVIWSLSSGKQAIAFDGKEVFFDVCGASQTKLTYAWEDSRGRIFEVKIHAAPMSTKMNPNPDWKQYDLLVDGVSYFHMPKIFELGAFAKVNRNEGPRFSQHTTFSQPPSFSQAPTMESILQAEEQPPMIVEEPAQVAALDLLSFDDLESAHQTAAPPQAQPAPIQNNIAATQNVAPSINPFVASAPPVYANPYEAPSTQPVAVSSYPFTPSASVPSSDPFAAPTTNVPELTQISPNSSPISEANRESPKESHQFAYPQSAPPSMPSKNLVNLDDLFGSSGPSTIMSVQHSVNAANAHKSLGELKGGNNRSAAKQPVMNSFNLAPARAQYPQQTYNNYTL